MDRLIREIGEQAERHPERRALVDEEEAVDYATLTARAARLSHTLTEAGVAPGDIIAVVLPNGLPLALVMLAAADAGAVVAPVAPGLAPEAMARAFAASDATHLVAGGRFLGELPDTVRACFPGITGAVLAAGGRATDAISLDTGLAARPQGAAFQGRGRDDVPFILTATSGSTGAPKPVVLSRATKVRRARAAIDLYAVTGADVTLAATPMYHSLAMRLVFLPLLAGATGIIAPRFTPAEFIRQVADHGVTFTIAVASQLTGVIRHLADTPEDVPRLASLRCVVGSSAPMEAGDKASFREKVPGDLHECYGTSELGVVSNLAVSRRPDKIASVGLPDTDVRVRILGADGGDVPRGETGEIICTSPMMFDGYYRQPETTRDSLWEGFFRTGDLGSLDDEGFLYCHGRCKDVIITGGINVHPGDVEAVLKAHPAVADCAAFARPDPVLGEVVAAAVVPVEPDTFHPRDLRRHCLDHLADFQQPRHYCVLSALPRTELGKVARHELPRVCGIPE